MGYFTSFGDLQRELNSYFRQTGKRMQFNEAVDSLHRKGMLAESFEPLERQDGLSGMATVGEFAEVVDEISFPVTPSAGLTDRVNEDDIIPLLRDIFIIRHPRYTRPYLHKHNYVELDYVAEGRCIFHFEKELLPLRRGELSVIAPGSRHDIEITDESTVYCIMLRRSVFESTFFSLLLHRDALSLFFRTSLEEQTRPNYLIFRTAEPEQSRNLLQMAMIECHALDPYSNICCISLTNLFLAGILRSSCSGDWMHRGRDRNDFSPVLRYIQQNYRTLTLTELADRFHYSKPHLCTLIKQNTGVSFTGLIRRIRMARAVDYLLHSDQSVSDIAEAVGYHSSDHFSRVFRSIYDMSPLVYRKKNRGDQDRFIPSETN